MAQVSRSPRLAFLGTEPQLAPLPALAVFVAVVLTRWGSRHRTRKALAKLEPHMLRDIGVSAFAARREAGRMFWQG